MSVAADAGCRAARLASRVLSGVYDVLEAASELEHHLRAAGLTQGDAALDAFTVITSETDGLPVGAVRSFWDPAVLRARDAELTHARMWAREMGLPACAAVVQRFGHLTGRCT